MAWIAVRCSWTRAMCWRTVRMAVHGTRRRESVSWDYPGLLQLLAGLAMERSRLPLLRCYWYDSTVEGRRSPDHDALADLPGVKLRLAKMRPGRREGVEGEIHRDLTTLARNKAVSDAMVVSGGRGSRAGHRRRPGHGHAGHPAAHRQRRQRRDPARAPPGVRRHRADQRLPAAAVRRADLRGRAAAPRRPRRRDARDPRGLQRQRARQRPRERPRERPGAARARRPARGRAAGGRPGGRRQGARRGVRHDRRLRQRLGLPAARRLPGRPGLRRPRSPTTEFPPPAPGLPFPTSRPRLPPRGRSSRPGPRRPRARTASCGRNRRNCPRGRSCTRRRSPSRRPPRT